MSLPSPTSWYCAKCRRWIRAKAPKGPARPLRCPYCKTKKKQSAPSR